MPTRHPATKLHLERLEDRTQPSANLIADLVPVSGNSVQDDDFFNSDVRVNLVTLGTATYFIGEGGSDLWRSDGTAAGTVKVASFPNVSAQELTVSGDRLYFTGYELINFSREVWTSDGTAAGTRLLTTIGEDAATNVQARQLTDVNGTLYFVSNGELWKTNGTTNGTRRITDSNIGSVSPARIAAVGETLFFSRTDAVNGYELWKTDGTASGTVLVKDIVPGAGGSSPFDLTAAGNTLFFQANDGVNGYALWKSDGTAAGTVLVKDLRTSAFFSGISWMTGGSDKLYFMGNDGVTGNELWVSDGTAAGTFALDLNPAGDTNPAPLKGVGGHMYFFADAAPTPGLYRTDGTLAGTTLLATVFRPVGIFLGELPQQAATVIGTELYFTADAPGTGKELWKTDGTAAGTALVKDIVPGAGGSLPVGLTTLNGTLVFAATTPEDGRELWTSDGTAAGTALVRDLDPTLNSNSGQLTASGGKVFFTTNFEIPGIAFFGSIWVTDGTAAGTTRLKEFGPDFTGLQQFTIVTNLTDVNGTLYFSTFRYYWFSGYSIYQLWKSDGTTTGTVLLSEHDNLPISDLAAFNGSLYFSLGSTLYRNNGAPGVTALPATGVDNLTAFNGWLYFTATSPAAGTELWRTDGTAAGTALVADVRPGSVGSSPANLTVAGGSLYFTADGGASGRELWRTDGTTTALVRDINPGAGSSNVANMTAVGGALYFTADDGTHGTELWRTDGTAAGTVMVEDINSPTEFRALTDVGGTLYFWTAGALWRSAGTAASTYRVKAFAAIDGAAVLGGRLYVAGDGDGQTGLWTTDGSATVRVGSPAGPRPFAVTDLRVSGGHLYFVADDGLHGREPWKLDPSDLFQTATIAAARSSINLTTNGAIAVTVFGAADFDVQLIDPLSVDFAGASAYQFAYQDVDGDGRLDLTLHFRVQDTNLRGVYEQLLAEDHDGDGVLDTTQQTASVSLAGALAGGYLFTGTTSLDLSLTGRQLRDLLDELFGD